MVVLLVLLSELAAGLIVYLEQDQHHCGCLSMSVMNALEHTTGLWKASTEGTKKKRPSGNCWCVGQRERDKAVSTCVVTGVFICNELAPTPNKELDVGDVPGQHVT